MHRNYTELQWGCEQSTVYKKLISKFGLPSFINRNPRGVAVWKNIGNYSPFKRVMIVDENVKQLSPFIHNGFLYVTINYEVDDRKIPDIMNCGNSVMYDKLKQELTVRSNNLPNAMMWLIVVHDINRDVIDGCPINEIKKRGGLANCNAIDNYNTLQLIKKDNILKGDYSCY